MKRIILFLIFIFSMSFMYAQKTNSSINELLDRLEQNGNSATAEPENLFTSTERALLQEYFSHKSSGADKATTDDVFAFDAGYCGDDFGTFLVGGPYDINAITTSTSAMFAGDFDGTGTLYALNNDSHSLVTLDTTTGAETVVGSLVNMGGDTVSGLMKQILLCTL